ncbi:MAG: DUF1573 domain-containing protein [Fluviicola sp.]|nr:DUF1573 domain-containing protein [Fluviicola sp.]
MKGLIIGFIFGFNVSLSAQDVLVFEQKKVDLGNIVQHSGTGKLKLEVTNTGTEPVIITSSSTGDGGTFAEYPREPIAPGKKGIITFVYSADYIGPRNRTLLVNYSYRDAENTILMPIKYQIILPQTTVQASPTQLTTKPLAFNEMDTLRIQFLNAGHKPLHLDYPYYYSVNKEILFVKLEVIDSTGKRREVSLTGCLPNECIEAMIVVKNIYGGKHSISHTMDFAYNSLDTLNIPLTINSNENASTSIQVGDREIYHYSNGELTRLDECFFNGKINMSYYFEKGVCTKTIRYDTYSKSQIISFYSGNKIVKKETFPLGTD